MRYANARDVLPETLVRELQKVVQGGYLYVPKDEHSRKRWGEESGYREELEARNRRICEEHDSGMSVGKLAERYGLSVHAIRKIVYRKRGGGDSRGGASA